MEFLPIILIFLFIITLILNYLSNISANKSSIQIMNEMGIGYNLGNSFDSYLIGKKIKSPDEQITLLGNPIPNKNLIINLKKSGFKTIRFPVSWTNFIDEFGNVNQEWMKRVKEVVKWIINKKLYCILNIHDDGDDDSKKKDKYINLWRKIAEEFKDFNENLIFELKNKPKFVKSYYELDYDALLNFSQDFIDIVRKSGGFNSQRLLIISVMNSEIFEAFNNNMKIPTDSANKFAISIHYFEPEDFTLNKNSKKIWGSENEYKEIFSNFEKLKETFIIKGIPIIITEVGVKTEINKNESSIREYLYTIFSLSNQYNGILSCLWDTSQKKFGNMNYFNRETYEWYDNKIKNIFIKLSKNQNIKIFDYYIKTTTETIYEPSTNYGEYYISLNKKTPLIIKINANYKGQLYKDYFFYISSYDQKGYHFYINFGKENSKKQYDGTIIYTIDLSKIDCNNYIEVTNYYSLTFSINNITVEYKENFITFDYKSFKAQISKEIN